MIFSTRHRYILMSFSLIIAIAITSMSVVSATPTSQLLQQCEQHFKADRLTTGSGGTALSCYEAVLKQDPTNRKAWRGLDKIKARYRLLIKKSANRGQQNRVRAYQKRIALVAEVKTRLQISAYLKKFPLHAVANFGLLDEAKKLIRLGEDIEKKDSEGKTPLFIAVNNPAFISNRMQTAKIQIVELLLEKGANVNIQDNVGGTPLHYAVFSGKIEPVRLLLKYGARIDIKDKDGLTPVYLAEQLQNNEILKILKK